MGERSGQPDVTALVERHYRSVYRYAYRLCGSAADAEDLTQQTFLQAQSCLDQLRAVESALAWLCSILCNQYRRQLRLRRPLLMADWDGACEATDERSNDLPFDIDPEQLQQVLGAMPEEFRMPVILFYFQDLSYREIAACMNTPVGTVMSRLARGKEFLRWRLRVGGMRPEAISLGRGSDGL